MVDVIAEAKLSKELNCAACNFIKHPGHMYHLYERPSGQKYLSMLSPEVFFKLFHFLFYYVFFRTGLIHHTHSLEVIDWNLIYPGERLNKKIIMKV